MRTVRTDILSEIRRSHRPDAGPVHSERTAGKGSHTAGNRSSAEDHCRANRDWLGEPVKLGVRKKIRLVAVDLPKGTSYRRKPRSGGRTPRLTLRRPSGIPPRMISPGPAPRGLRDGSLEQTGERQRDQSLFRLSRRVRANARSVVIKSCQHRCYELCWGDCLSGFAAECLRISNEISVGGGR